MSSTVLPFPNNLYAQWRVRHGAACLLREDGGPPPERLLQAIWQHQRLRRDRLVTLDGTTVEILHPGFLNREGGPDFRGAVIRFGNGEPLSGDVEIDIRSAGWSAHGHDRNPTFADVVLHVIWEQGGVGHARRPSSGGTHPEPRGLAICDKLDAPVSELGLCLNSEPRTLVPELWRGRCCEALRLIPDDRRSCLLREAAEIRFRSKASQLQARARDVGWEQSLWEGLFRALGYKQNAWPMHRLAEQRERWLCAPVSTIELQARLLGIANLLPTDMSRLRPSADGYLRRVWDHWWRERDRFADCILPVSVWRFHGQRPANHPQRRLALAAHWLTSGCLVSALERWCACEVPERQLTGSLLEVLITGPDDFWSWHWTLRSGRLNRPQPLVGSTRVTDLAVNVILPWIWIRAVEGRNERMRAVVERRFMSWPAAQDNAVLRLARERLWSGGPQRTFHSAAEQQGCLQIRRDFCDLSDSVCRNCNFPGLVKAWCQE